MLNPNEESENKVLGIHGIPNMMSLLLAFEFKNLLKMLRTKRELLNRVASIFDPVGILPSAVVLLKILFQKICKEGSSWDDDIKDECKVVWKKIVAKRTENS